MTSLRSFIALTNKHEHDTIQAPMKTTTTNIASKSGKESLDRKGLVLSLSIYGVLFAGWLLVQMHK